MICWLSLKHRLRWLSFCLFLSFTFESVSAPFVFNPFQKISPQSVFSSQSSGSNGFLNWFKIKEDPIVDFRRPVLNQYEINEEIKQIFRTFLFHSEYMNPKLFKYLIFRINRSLMAQVADSRKKREMIQYLSDLIIELEGIEKIEPWKYLPLLEFLKKSKTSNGNLLVGGEVMNLNEKYKSLVRYLIILGELGEGAEIEEEDWQEADMSPIEGDLYVVSDTHFTGQRAGGFEVNKYARFMKFLQVVASKGGNLVINGDLLESYINVEYFYKHLDLIYSRLRKIKRVFFLPGNHDDHFEQLNGKRWKNITFLDSMSVLLKNKDVIHIEHGHKSDYFWNHGGKKINHNGKQKGSILHVGLFARIWDSFLWFTSQIIMRVFIKSFIYFEEKGYPIRIYGIWFLNWMLFVLFPLQLLQLIVFDLRIRELRSEMSEIAGFRETKDPVYKRIFTWRPWYHIKRLLWELKEPEKDESTFHYVIGHYHELDIWLFKGTMFSFWFGGLILNLIQRKSTRVKVYFSTGSWTLPLHWKSDLKYKLIKPDGQIQRCDLNKTIQAYYSEIKSIPIQSQALFDRAI